MIHGHCATRFRRQDSMFGTNDSRTTPAELPAGTVLLLPKAENCLIFLGIFGSGRTAPAGLNLSLRINIRHQKSGFDADLPLLGHATELFSGICNDA
jgi:hypothetical protein